MQLWFVTQSFMLLVTQQPSAEYDLQSDSDNMRVSYNTMSCLCHTWKVCICFGVCILIKVPFFCSATRFLAR